MNKDLIERLEKGEEIPPAFVTTITRMVPVQLLDEAAQALRKLEDRASACESNWSNEVLDLGEKIDELEAENTRLKALWEKEAAIYAATTLENTRLRAERGLLRKSAGLEAKE